MKAFLVIGLCTALLVACNEQPASPVAAPEVAGTSTTPVQPPKEPEALGAGGMWKFGLDSRGSAALKEGWSNPEPWGVWSASPKAVLALKLDPSVQGKPLAIDFDVQGFVRDKVPSQTVIVSTGNEQLAKWDFAFPDKVQGIRTVVIPAALNAGGAELRLSLAFSNPTSPKSLGMGEDVRALGIGLTSAIVKVASDPSAPAPVTPHQ